MKFEEIEAESFSRKGFPPHVKSPVIWGSKGSLLFPMCYLHRPKSSPISEWEKFLDAFKYSLTKKEPPK